MSLLSVRRVWKHYGEQVVLENLNLEFQAGEFCTLVGASGCGKSTFLRLLLSQETPSRGEILLDGQPLPLEPGPERGVVFQRYSVFPHLTVEENVIMGWELRDAGLLGRCFGARRRELREQAAETLQAVGLYEARKRYPAALSGGMQQRLAIAQALVLKPRVLLLDEPFGALDPGIRADMHELILSLWQDTKMLILMVTHDIREGFELGTRLMVFDRLRRDPQAPGAFGAGVTYDIPLTRSRPAQLLAKIDANTRSTARFHAGLHLAEVMES